MSSEKDALRQEYKAKRDAMPLPERSQAAQSLCLHYKDHPFLAPCQAVAGYYPIGSEADILPLFQQLNTTKRTTGLPRIQEKNLTLHHWASGETLEEGPFSTRQPAESQHMLVPDLLLVPLLAFDAAGHRLGYGGGYYDRFIEQLRALSKPPLIVGVAYSGQECDTLPIEEHDQPLDGILTEVGVSFYRGFL